MAIQRNLFTAHFICFALLTAAPLSRANEKNHVLASNEHLGVILENPIYDLFVDDDADELWDIFEPLVSRKLFPSDEIFKADAPVLRKNLREATQDPLKWSSSAMKNRQISQSSHRWVACIAFR
ncbi:MAG TPA: hypothetical protein VM901_11260 [Bdellovibrionota bacterium]|jgi:hypothetical protein|nr:hypothetical protein [Bdellovibrionota bacterium]